MFRSRHTIALAIIALYFIPMLFLSYYGMSSNPAGKTWSLFSFGLFFGIVGSLILILLMIQFEADVNLSKKNKEDEKEPLNSFFEDDQQHLDFDTIIVNLNGELDSKKQEILNLSKENLTLTSRLKEMEFRIQSLSRPISEVQADLQEEKEEVIETLVKKEEPKTSIATPDEPSFHSIQNMAQDIDKIEQSLYQRDNRVEVTKL